MTRYDIDCLCCKLPSDINQPADQPTDRPLRCCDLATKGQTDVKAHRARKLLHRSCTLLSVCPVDDAMHVFCMTDYEERHQFDEGCLCAYATSIL